MDDIFRQLALANYANHMAALDYRNALYLEYYGRGEWSGGVRDGLRWCRIADGVFNIIYGAQLGDGESCASGTVLEMSRRVDEEWREPARWFVSAGDEPQWLGRAVEEAGWEYGYAWPEMGFDLTALRDKDVESSGGLSIKIVEREELVPDWMSVQRAGYELQGALAEYLTDMARAFVLDERRGVTLYLACAGGGEPAGVAALFAHEGAAGIYMVASHPRQRRRGIASALMRRMMYDARERFGCSVCVLQSSDIAVALYRSLGFVQTGQTAIYHRQPPIGAAR